MTTKYKKKEIKKVDSIMRFIKSLDNCSDKWFKDYMARKEIKR